MLRQGREERITYSSHGHPTGQSKSGHDDPPWSPDGCPQPCLAPPIPKETQHAAELPHLSTSQLLSQAACRNANTTQQSRLQVGSFSWSSSLFQALVSKPSKLRRGRRRDWIAQQHVLPGGRKGSGNSSQRLTTAPLLYANLSTPGAETGEGAASPHNFRTVGSTPPPRGFSGKTHKPGSTSYPNVFTHKACPLAHDLGIQSR